MTNILRKISLVGYILLGLLVYDKEYVRAIVGFGLLIIVGYLFVE